MPYLGNVPSSFNVDTNNINNGAVTSPKLSSGLNINLDSGSAATPSLTFDANTGLYSPGEDQLAISTGGSGRLFIDSSGRLLTGTSSSLATKYFASSFQPGLQSAAVSGTGGFFRYSADSDAATLVLSKSRNASTGSQTVVVDGDTLGYLGFTGSDGTAFQTAATIYTQVDGTPGANDMPGRLIFATTADGASSTTERMRIDSSGRVGIGTTSPSTTLHVNSASGARVRAGGAVGSGFEFNDANTRLDIPAANNIAAYTSGVERARIDSSGRLLVGTSSVVNAFATTFQVQVLGSSLGTSGQLLAGFADDATSSGALTLGKSRNTTKAAGIVVQSGDRLGFIGFVGDDGTALIRGAQILAEVDGTPGANDMPGRLVFSTTADGASSPTERFRIGSAGQLGVGGANYGTTGQVLTSGGASAAPTWGSSIVSGTAVASTSGTSIDFTGIPSWVKRVTVMLNEVSTNGSSAMQIQIGAGSITSSGYTGYATRIGAAPNNVYTAMSAGFLFSDNLSATATRSGLFVLTNISSNNWVLSGSCGSSTTTGDTCLVNGKVSLSGTLDRIRITTVNGTDTFDAGSINILYE